MRTGTFLVSLQTVTSVSWHEYVVDGVARVSEVTLGILGPVQPRFYFVEPLKPQSPLGVGDSGINALEEKLQEAKDRVDPAKASDNVVKNYPVSTHAHTVEYRLSSRESLEKLFQDLEIAWRRRQAGTFKEP